MSPYLTTQINNIQRKVKVTHEKTVDIIEGSESNRGYY